MSMGGELTNGWSLVADNSGDGSAAARSDQRASSSWRAFKSALLLGAASCIAYPASAQQAPDAVPLPQLNVEATAKKKAAAKKGATKKAAQPRRSAAPSRSRRNPSRASSPTAAATPGGNPYANPNAPYKVERSASGKLTEPLLNTPKTVTAMPKEVIEDKDVRDLRELARNARPDHRHRRGRQRLRRLRNPRLQGQQRHLRRRHPQSRQLGPGRVRRRAGRDLQGPERRDSRA